MKSKEVQTAVKNKYRNDDGPMKISRKSVQQILREDLGCFPYKKIKQSKLTALRKRRRVKFANWIIKSLQQKLHEKMPGGIGTPNPLCMIEAIVKYCSSIRTI